VDGRGLLHRVIAHVLHEQTCLEDQEVLRIAREVSVTSLLLWLFGEAVRVLALREGHHLHVEAFLQDQVDAAQAGLHARRITVVQDADGGRVALDQAHLVLGEAGAAAGHHVGDAGLMQADDVRVAFHQVAQLLLHDGALGMVDAVERAALVVEYALRTVEVLGELLVALQRTRTEGDGLAAETQDRKGDAPSEEVPSTAAAIIAPLDPSGLLQDLGVESVGRGCCGERVAELWHIAQLERADGGITEAALVEVGEADALALIAVPQLLHAPRHGPLLHHSEALALALLHLLFGRLLLLRQVDVVPLGQPTNGLHVAQVLVFLQERDAIAALATAEALEDAQVGTDVETRRLLVVERA
jgi:hypothetical protein